MSIMATVGEWSTAIATLLGALGAFISAVYALKVGKKNEDKIENVHEIVNGKNKSVEDRNTELIKLLQDNGVEIPPKKVP